MPPPPSPEPPREAAPGAVAEARRGLWAIGALLGGATVMSQAAADARFLAQLGPRTLAIAMALSSALLALVLVAVGALADRAAKRRVLAGLAGIAAAALCGFAALGAIAPAAAAWLGFLGAKQLAAAADLSFWMLATERLDARESVRALPRLSAVGGIGGAVSAALAMPLAGAGGPSAVMVGAAGLLVVAAVVAWRMPSGPQELGGDGAGSRGGAAPMRVPMRGTMRRAVQDGVACVVESPLARRLAALVGLGGAFAALVYVGLSASAAGARVGGADSDEALTALLSGIRSAAQIATVLAQLVVAPWVLRRFGTASALLISPAVAVLGAVVVAVEPSLAAFVALSIASRALDQAVETPAQKLVHTLLPAASRGRVVGFVEGVAKRSGAVIAGLAAALVVQWPLGFGALVAASALAWLAAAAVMARKMPALAVASSVDGAASAGTTTRSPSLGPRALQRLRQDLDEEGAQRGRAVEVLVKQAAEGQGAACQVLLEAAAASRGTEAEASVELWEAAALALAHTPATKLREEWRAIIAAAVQRAREAGREDEAVAALGALGLAGEAAALDSSTSSGSEALAYAAAQAARWPRDPAAAISAASDELRYGDERSQAIAAAELRRYAVRALVERDDALCLAVAWPLLTLVRRGSEASPRVVALALLTEIVERLLALRSAEIALLRSELRALAHALVEARRGESSTDETAEPTPAAIAAAAVKLLGATLAAEAKIAPDLGDDLSLVVALLADRDEEVSEAAAIAVRRIGVAATAALVTLAGYGRRAARDRAAALLRELPATEAALDQLVELELSALESTCLALGALATAPIASPLDAPIASPLDAPLASPLDAPIASPRAAALDALLARRLDERGREIAYTVLLLAAARDRRPPIGTAAAQWRSARGRFERARALAVLDTTLPRALAARLLEPIEEVAPLPRAQAVARRSGRALPTPQEAIGGELGGSDALSRRILLARLPAAALARHRGALAGAAHHLARTADPGRLLRRLAATTDPTASAADEGADMPSPVETLLALSQLPLFATLSTRQLDELARRARRRKVAAGAVIAARGQPLETLILVEEGALQLGARAIAAGQLAWLAPRSPDEDLLAAAPSRLLEIDRASFEELADDVPGLGAGVCRVLAERLRERG